MPPCLAYLFSFFKQQMRIIFIPFSQCMVYCLTYKFAPSQENSEQGRIPIKMRQTQEATSL